MCPAYRLTILIQNELNEQMDHGLRDYEQFKRLGWGYLLFR